MNLNNTGIPEQKETTYKASQLQLDNDKIYSKIWGG